MSVATPDRKATPDQLKRDCVSICQQIYSSWDGEVDVMVVLLPRRLTSLKDSIAYGTTIDGKERIEAVISDVHRQVKLGVRDLKVLLE